MAGRQTSIVATRTIVSGGGVTTPHGGLLRIDADEAARLIGLGCAVPAPARGTESET